MRTSYSKFDGNTKLSEALEVLGYELKNMFAGHADLYKGEKKLLERANQEQVWHYLLKNHSERFSGRTKVT
jgi:hypothetical protein